MDPMGTIDSIYKEEYYTLICTKYESYGPCNLENIFFQYKKSFNHSHTSMMLQIKFDRIWHGLRDRHI